MQNFVAVFVEPNPILRELSTADLCVLSTESCNYVKKHMYCALLTLFLEYQSTTCHSRLYANKIWVLSTINSSECLSHKGNNINKVINTIAWMFPRNICRRKGLLASQIKWIRAKYWLGMNGYVKYLHA